MHAVMIDNISKKYSGKKFKNFFAVNSLSLNIVKGEVFGFLGPNGAGKSTTIKAIMGLITPDSGEITINGIPSGKTDSRRLIGYLPENPSFFDTLSGREYLRFVGRSFAMTATDINDAINRHCSYLELTDSLNRPIRSYSKGMVQRLGIAQTLIHDPEIFILDEPMSGLDPVGRAMVKDIIIDLKKQGKTVFFSTHITSDVEKVCDRVAILKAGKLCLLESVADTQANTLAGYQIRFTSGNAEVVEELFVQTDVLSSTISRIESSGSRIIVVEPVRKGLEELFLQVIKG